MNQRISTGTPQSIVDPEVLKSNRILVSKRRQSALHLEGPSWLGAALVVVWTMIYSCPGQEVQVYFGNLHAHSNASDGNKNISPAEAFTIARDQGKMDFMSLSEHNHIMKSQDIYDEVQEAAEGATDGNFVALYGQEFSIIKMSNHVSIENYPRRLGPSLNGKFKKVFGEILPKYKAAHPGEIVFGEFNHPGLGDIETDYGMETDFHGDFDEFVATLDPVVRLIAVASGPADSGGKAKYPHLPLPKKEQFVQQKIDTDRWFEYLSHGMHLAPKIDHDSHSPTYGFRHAGRTAVWVSGSFDRKSLLDALNRRHCYATQDMNLKIIPKLDVAGNHLPGDVIDDTDDNTIPVTLTINDTDEPNAKYEAELYSGVTGSKHLPKPVSGSTSNRDGDGPLTLTIHRNSDRPEYFIIHISQKSDDPLNHAKTDDAWLAPIWFERTDESDH